jgi:cytochrome P450
MYALPRYQQVREASGNWRVFSSAKGVMMNDEINSMLEGITLCNDPPEHTGMRRVLARPMRPEKLRELTSRVGEAERIVAQLVAKGTFDAATELAEHLPLTIVSDLVGLCDAGRDRMLHWAAATFDAQGPMNRRTTEAFPKLDEMIHFAMTEAVPGKLDPGGWADSYRCAANGELAVEKCLHDDRLHRAEPRRRRSTRSRAPSGCSPEPEQWDLVRKHPSLIPHAINEALPLESPVQRFTRLPPRTTKSTGTCSPPGRASCCFTDRRTATSASTPTLTASMFGATPPITSPSAEASTSASA